MIKKKFYYLLIPFLLSCSNQEIIIPEKWGENIPLVGSEDEILISHISGSSKKLEMEHIYIGFLFKTLKMIALQDQE